MLTLSKLSKSYGDRTLFEDVSLHIAGGERIVLVGPNGAGKSTLFSLILGQNSPDEGTVSLDRGTLMGHLPQETAHAGDETVVELAMGMAAGEEITDYSREPKAKRILKGLSFRDSDFDRPVKALSGGWIMRAHLARLLVLEPDLLLLDEPTNHLDLISLEWCRDYLKGYRGAILMISHDRDFINVLADSIVEIDRGKVTRYRGNYEAYLTEKVAREEQLLAAYKNQQKEIESLQRFADRFRAKASKASQAQSKLRQIERMDKIEAPVSQSKTVAFRFPQPPRGGQRAIRLSGIDHAYGENIVYEGMDFSAERGERVVLVGPNGAGKSTLLKLLAGVIEPQAGTRELGHNVRVGYFAQHRAAALDYKKTVLQEAMDLEKPLSEQMTRTLLGAFLFSGDDVFKKVGVLSGGEKSRLAMAKLLMEPPNLLLMDEPTTHLDMASIEALIHALEAYEGTVIFISHDVYFIRSIARQVLHVDSGKLKLYPGGYDYFLEKTGAKSARAALTSGSGEKESGSQEKGGKSEAVAVTFKSKEQKRQEAEERQQKAKRKKELEEKIRSCEADITEMEKEQAAVTAELESSETYRQPGRAQELNRSLMALQQRLELTNQEWSAAVEALAAL